MRTQRRTRVAGNRMLVPVLCVAAFCSSNAFAQTTSPFEPPEERLGTYVVNSGPDLDTGCVFSGRGPLIVEIPVPATVNPAEIDPDGTLKDPFKLIDAGILKQRVRIGFPVFDIDSQAMNQGSNPEVDRITFNGVVIGNLKGADGAWTDGGFLVDIDVIRFQTPQNPNVTNTLKIDIDTANTSETWCMGLDWVSIEFTSAAPYILVHGIAAQLDSWDEAGAPGVLTTLDASGVLYTRTSLVASGSSGGNAKLLQAAITNFLAPLKGKEIHVIAHSKGGLDTQALRWREPPFDILSLSTLSSPHLGSSAADLSLVLLTLADDKTNNGPDPKGYAKDYMSISGLGTWVPEFVAVTPQRPGLDELTTYRATFDIDMSVRGNIDPTFTYGASADLNSNGMLEENESAVLFPGAAHFAAKNSWSVLRTIAASPILRVAEIPGTFFGTRRVMTYLTVSTSTPQKNDIVVTLTSANPDFGEPQGNSNANHSLVKNAANITDILKNTIPIGVN